MARIRARKRASHKSIGSIREQCCSISCRQPRSGYPYPRNTRTCSVCSSVCFVGSVLLFLHYSTVPQVSGRLTYRAQASDDTCLRAGRFDAKLGRSLGGKQEEHELREGKRSWKRKKADSCRPERQRFKLEIYAICSCNLRISE